MSNQEVLLVKGRSCIEAAKKACEYLLQTASSEQGRVSPGAEEALNRLASLREDGRQLKEAAQRSKEEQQDRQKTLQQQLAAAGGEGEEKPQQDPEAALARLHRKRQQEQSRLLKLQRNMELAQNKLTAAEEVVRRAKSQSRAKTESAATAMYSSGAVPGAVVGFGIGELVRTMLGHRLQAPPSPASESVRRAERDAAARQEEVKNTKHKIALAEKSLGSVQKEISAQYDTISSNDNAKSSLLAKISSAESAVAFQSEVVEFWELFIQASSLGSEHAQCLERLVGWEEEVREVKVLRSSGYATEALGFTEAWEEVTFQHGLVLQQGQ